MRYLYSEFSRSRVIEILTWLSAPALLPKKMNALLNRLSCATCTVIIAALSVLKDRSNVVESVCSKTGKPIMDCAELLELKANRKVETPRICNKVLGIFPWTSDGQC